MTKDDAVVLMPTWGACPTRAENQAVVTHHYATRYRVPVVLGTGIARAHSINHAARLAGRDHPDRRVFIIADNDLIPSELHLLAAIASLDRHAAATPHSTTLMTTSEGRAEYLATGHTTQHETQEKGSRSYVVIHRDTFAAVNGMDEHFIGWGPEDRAFLYSVQKQAGAVLELDGARLHLWHPADPTKRDARNLNRNRARMRAYSRATSQVAHALARQYGRWNEPRHGAPERAGPPDHPPGSGGDGVAAGRHATRPGP